MASRTTTDPIEILLEMGIDLDNLSEEEDYLSALKEAIAIILVKTKGGGDERSKVLLDEVVKVRKSRKAADPTFKARKKKISADSFKKKTSSIKALPGTSEGGALVVKKTKISAEDIKSNDDKNILESILGSVTNISDMLKEQYDLEKKNDEKDRKSTEKTKRKLQESGLEKAFKGLAKTTEKVIAPVKSLLEKIFGFITTVLLARFLNKFIDWFADPDNRSKIKSIIRFLGDNWPKLLSAYIIFGTGLGKFSRFIVKLLARGAVRLAAATAGLLARLFGSRALGKFSRFFGRRGKLIAGGVEAVTTIIAFKALEDSFTKGLGPEESASIDNDIPTKGYQGGGLVQPLVQPILLLNGGGQAFNLLNPLSWFGGGSQKAVKGNKERYKPNSLSGRLLNRRNATNEAIQKMRGYEEGGEVDGTGGIDQVPAMLTDGEFVMSRGAVQKYGVGQLEAMNASGGGTNKPKIMDNMVYAATGGYIGRGSGAGSPEEGYPSKLNSFTNRFVMGDDSLLNKLALGDTDGVLKTLGIKIDRNTDAANRNTTQRKENNNILKDFLRMSDGFVKDRIGDVKNIPSKVEGFAPTVESFVKNIPSKVEGFAPTVESFVKNIPSMGGGFVDALKDKRKGISEFIEKTPYFGETAAIERERKLGLMKPGADSLLPEVKERLKSNDERIRNLYDPEKDTGFMGGLKKMNQTIQNKGAIVDPFAALGLKNEGTEKFVEKITGGRVKNLGAKITGLQFAAKGLLGPLGKAFQIDDKGSLGRYLRPAMEKAQSMGLSGVGNNKQFNEGKGAADRTNNYNTLVGDKLANLALGQTSFTVGEDGRAKTSDVYDSNNTAEYYLKTSREALSKGNIGPALFNGLSGLLRVNQNTGWGNLRPGGNDIDLGGGFEQTDSSGKVKKVSKMSGAQLLNAQAYAESKGKYFSSTDGKTYESYQAAVDAKKARLASSKPNVSIPAPPPKPEPKVVVENTKSGGGDSSGSGNSGTNDVDAANPGSGTKSKWNILGIPMPF